MERGPREQMFLPRIEAPLQATESQAITQQMLQQLAEQSMTHWSVA